MTGDIIDAIDGACGDWVPSADAMRWRPASAPPPSIVRTGWTPSGVILDEAADIPVEFNTEPWVHWPGPSSGEYRPMTIETVAPGIAAVAEAFEAACEVASKHLEHIAEVFRDASAQVTEFSRLFGPQQATRDALSPRVPAYQDCRPRWQSPYGPARRR